MPNQNLILPVFFLLSAVSGLNAQNDKQVLGDAVFTPLELADGAQAVYLIRFQNIGIDTADNIVVRDTLDPRLDASTLVMIDASHDYELLQDQGFVRWYFNGIQLPSSDEDTEFSRSSGYVLFSVQPRTFLEPGQTIQNRACISFDDEPPLCTDYATIWIDEGAKALEAGGDLNREYKIVPNPNYGQFEVRKTNPKPAQTGEKIAWWVCDMTGKTIWDGSSQDLATTTNQVMLERPAPGLYMLWMKNGARLQVEQFAVIR